MAAAAQLAKLDQSINRLWKEANEDITRPNVNLGLYKGAYYVTVNDDRGVYFFASRSSKIYAAVKSKCEVKNLAGGVSIYNIAEDDALQVISCPKEGMLLGDAEKYVLQSIVPKILGSL